jgi:hypothetical protein
LVSFLYTFRFNPIYLGHSTSLFYENALAREILDQDRRENHRSLWATFGPAETALVLSNFPRILGVRALDGAHGYPQISLWKKWDPEGKAFSVYNQVAYTFFLPGEKGEAGFVQPAPGQVAIRADPALPLWDELGVTHFLVALSLRDRFSQVKGLSLKYCGQEACIFKRASPE